MRLVVLLCLPMVLAFASPPRIAASRPTLNLRGGGKSDYTYFSDLASSLSTVVKKHVEPVLKDPNGRILRPLSHYARQQAKKAKERQARYRSAPHEALGLVFLSPFRIVRMSVTALVLAEVLDYMGVLQDPQATTDRVKNALKSANIPSVQNKAKIWWSRSRQQGGLLHPETYTSPRATLATSWQPKHQFALGAGVGLMTSQLFWALTSQLLKGTVVVYGLSELNQLLKRQSGKSVTERFNSQMSEKVEAGLNTTRGAIRRAVQDPGHLMETIPEIVEQYVPDGGLPPSTRIGVASGLVAGILIA